MMKIILSSTLLFLMRIVMKNRGLSYQACFICFVFIWSLLYFFVLDLLCLSCFNFDGWTDCWEVLDCCRVTFEKTIFSDLTDINSLEMNSVNWAILKEVNKVEETEDIDFFEVAQFFVQRMYEERLNRLVSFFILFLLKITKFYFISSTFLLCEINS